MLTRETAQEVWCCYREIEAAQKLLEDMAEEEEREKAKIGTRYDPRYRKNLRDAFGQKRSLQLGVPSGENGHRIFDVDPDLAQSVIRAHIAKVEARLVAANEKAALEITSGEALSP